MRLQKELAILDGCRRFLEFRFCHIEETEARGPQEQEGESEYRGKEKRMEGPIG